MTVWGTLLPSKCKKTSRLPPVPPFLPGRAKCPQNHAFVDGNKRTAFAATYTFLAVNGLYLTADAEETYVFVASLYRANQLRFDKLVPWLRAHVEKRK